MTSRESSSVSDDDWDASSSRINQQLETLRSLVPDLAKGDKRSILEGARDYLQRIEREAEQIKKEVSEQSEEPDPSSSSGEGQRPIILQVETEEITERRFVVKIAWRRGAGVAGHVQRVIESLNAKMTSILVTETGPQQMLSVAFVKPLNVRPEQLLRSWGNQLQAKITIKGHVKKEVKMTEEGLQDLLITAAKKSSLL